jgi:hypothetical protein
MARILLFCVGDEGLVMAELEPAGTYRPQYHFRWRGMTRFLDRFPGLKARLADWTRRLLNHVFEPSLVTTG